MDGQIDRLKDVQMYGCKYQEASCRKLKLILVITIYNLQRNYYVDLLQMDIKADGETYRSCLKTADNWLIIKLGKKGE